LGSFFFFLFVISKVDKQKNIHSKKKGITMASRRSFLKAGVGVVLGVVTTKAALSIGSKDDLTPKNHLIPEEMDIPAIAPIEKERKIVHMTIGKGKDFETLQDYFNWLPSNLADSNIQYIGDICESQTISPELAQSMFGIKGTST